MILDPLKMERCLKLRRDEWLDNEQMIGELVVQSQVARILLRPLVLQVTAEEVPEPVKIRSPRCGGSP